MKKPRWTIESIWPRFLRFPAAILLAIVLLIIAFIWAPLMAIEGAFSGARHSLGVWREITDFRGVWRGVTYYLKEAQ